MVGRRHSSSSCWLNEDSRFPTSWFAAPTSPAMRAPASVERGEAGRDIVVDLLAEGGEGDVLDLLGAEADVAGDAGRQLRQGR